MTKKSFSVDEISKLGSRIKEQDKKERFFE
jgi:hypothetical protein